MADNTVLSTAVGTGDTVRDVQKGGGTGPKTQVVIIDAGGGGTELLLAAGQATMANSLPVVLASNQTAIPVTLSGGATSANQATEIASLASIDGKLPALGQALAAASVPVVLTAAQLTTLTPPAAITGFATSAKQDTGNTSLASIDGKLPALGQALAAASVPVVLTAAQLSTLTPLTTVAVTGTFWQATQPVSGTVSITANSAVNVAQINGVAATMGNGASGTGVLRVTVASDSTGQIALAAGSAVIGHVIVDSGTVTTVSTVTNLSQMGGVAIALNTGTRSAGTQRVTIATDDVVPASQSGMWTVQPGNTVNTVPWLVTDTPATSGGLSVASYIPTGAANQDQTSVKGSAGQLYGYAIFNTTASLRYVKIYNASAPTSGSTPVIRLMVPASSGLNVNIDKGIAFGTAIGFRCTTGIADNDTGAVTTNDLLITLWYK